MREDELLARIENLEMQVAHQDKTIDDLNMAITDQWKAFDALKRQLGKLGEQLRDVQANTGSSEPEPPPPHY